MNKKGISPLIATVILIGFVVAVATVSSSFFTSFTKQQASGIGDRGEDVSQCGMASLDIEPDSPNDKGNISVNIENTGSIGLSDLKMVIRDHQNEVHTYQVDDNEIEISEIKTIKTISNVSEDISGGISNITKIRVTTACPGVSASVVNDSGTWTVSY